MALGSPKFPFVVLNPNGDFKDIKSDGYLAEVLIELWDPSNLKFRIGNKEVT